MVKELHDGLLVNKRHGYSKTYMCSDFGAVDNNLYGGGKRGPDTKLVLARFFRAKISQY